MAAALFKKILVANRGEIAVRILRACREMGIATIAVYSEADRRALHVRTADEAIFLGPAEANLSYLSIEKVIGAAKASGADAIHPGYGFLAENAAFVQTVQDAGLTFIGPSAEAIAAMGDKGRSRDLMQAADVPVVPGYQGPDDDAVLAAQALEIGFPLLVKASAGGGGKGMRVVQSADADGGLEHAIAAARRECRHAFGDDRLILERYIPNARHIEFQVFADKHGNTVHLFERECSVQRRHQKIIEESPSPRMDADLRAKMGAVAVKAAQAVGYTNAGTIEFIVDPQTRAFYFLEMNTRLQVEHPVTELVTGLDLVQLQIRTAAGEALPFRQEDVQQRGHALECRLYAEDPANNFLPATGPLLRFSEPAGPGVRVDAGVTSGDEITIYYDPLIAKIIAYGWDRDTCVKRMQAALQSTVLLGLTNNNAFLQDVLSSEDFQAGNVYTTWVEEHFGDWQPPQCDLPPEVLAAAALSTTALSATALSATALAGMGNAASSLAQDGTSDDPFSPWKAASGYRVGEVHPGRGGQ